MPIESDGGQKLDGQTHHQTLEQGSNTDCSIKIRLHIDIVLDLFTKLF
jgi:hypothetical protein